MTLVWFVIWLIANDVGGHEQLAADPVNAWVGTLILAVALDLNRLGALVANPAGKYGRVSGPPRRIRAIPRASIGPSDLKEH